jgi:hypothetical protein
MDTTLFHKSIYEISYNNEMPLQKQNNGHVGPFPISAICIPFFKASRQLYLHIPFQFIMDLIREPNKHDTYRTVGGSHVKLYEVQEAVSHLQLITDEDATKENKFVLGMCLKITMSSTNKSSIKKRTTRAILRWGKETNRRAERSTRAWFIVGCSLSLIWRTKKAASS